MEKPRRRLPVIEVFGPTIQGEGIMAGMKTHFIRLGGCPRRCEWCDSMHAVDPAQIKQNAEWLYPEELVERVRRLPSAPWVTISGGDPMMWDLNLLVEGLQDLGYGVAIETQGDLYQDWVASVDVLTVSPKPPSAGPRDGDPNWDVIDRYACTISPLADMVLKVVIFDRLDLQFAEDVHMKYPDLGMYLSVGTPCPTALTGDMLVVDVAHRYRWLIDEALARPALANTRIFPQLHVIAWAEAKGV